MDGMEEATEPRCEHEWNTDQQNLVIDEDGVVVEIDTSVVYCTKCGDPYCG